MAHFIDRRQNPKDKSLGNRQRFLRRTRARIKEVVNKSVMDRKVTDIASGETVTIPTKGIDEPRFRHARSGGRRQRAFTGNKDFRTGDKVQKPSGGGQGAGKRGSDSGEGEDEFQFALTRDEFLDLFFEDLELPDLAKKSLKEVFSVTLRRAGHTKFGVPANLNIMRTMRNSFGRRIALKRPRSEEVEVVQRQILELEAKSEPSAAELVWLRQLHEKLEELDRKRRAVPFIDPIDIRYNNYLPTPVPNTQAVMFCLMDVSGSMGEREKDLAKRFFVLLHLFLSRCYERTEVVFVRHTHEAQEVDEDTFFRSRETGGTVVSTALYEMMDVLRARYPVNEWNIYAAQASDGENFAGDSEKCIALLDETIMPLCQYYAYIEIIDERERAIFRDTRSGAALWRAYGAVGEKWSNFAMKRIARPADIYPVFRELFSKKLEQS